MRKISSFLIVAALVAGLSGCAGVSHALTIASTAGGSVTTPGNQNSPYYTGEVVNLTAIPDAGYRFVGWTGDVETVADVNAASTTIVMQGSYAITAEFEEIRPVEYALSVSGNTGGSVTVPGVGTFTYEAGTVVSLTATPASGYRFVRWTGDVETVADANSASTTITIDGDYSIEASFEEIPPDRYNLTLSSTTGGSVTSPGEGTFVYHEGEVVNLAAEAEGGYQFVSWTGDAGTIEDVEAVSTTISISGDLSITASFEPNPVVQYELTITSTGGGWVFAPGTGTFTYETGTVVNLAAVAANNYRFIYWSGDVGTIGNVNSASTTITMNGSYSIEASFEAATAAWHHLSITSSPGGSVTTPGEGSWVCGVGTVVDLVATPASGYHFVNWTGDVDTVADANSASTTIRMDGDYSIEANFERTASGQFELTTSSTSGGSVTAPGEGSFTHEPGTVASLVATPASGYHFLNWTGDVETVADANSASTTITMDGSYSIRANFSADSSSPPGIGYTAAEAEALIIILVNHERQQAGLSALSADALLTSLAREHSISMVENGYFSHQRYPGQRSFNYGQPAGTIRGENLAMIPTRRTIPGPYLSLQEVCEWAVSAWMGSPGHRANILDPRYTITGVGVAFSEGGDYLYITQIFQGAY